jgi:hypothetical protein
MMSRLILLASSSSSIIAPAIWWVMSSNVPSVTIAAPSAVSTHGAIMSQVALSAMFRSCRILSMSPLATRLAATITVLPVHAHRTCSFVSPSWPHTLHRCLSAGSLSESPLCQVSLQPSPRVWRAFAMILICSTFSYRDLGMWYPHSMSLPSQVSTDFLASCLYSTVLVFMCAALSEGAITSRLTLWSSLNSFMFAAAMLFSM